MRTAFLYEHPTWSDALIAAFNQKGIELDLVNIADLSFDPNAKNCPYDVAINRINIMPSSGCDPQVVFQTLHYLNWLEVAGVKVLNGARAHYVGASKAMQNAIFSTLELNYPKAVAIYRMADAEAAAEHVGYPVIVKPNIGGSGSGIARYNSPAELEQAVRLRALDLGIDRSGLVQKYIESDGYVYRVEVLGDKLFYSIRQPVSEGSFNYCAADGCSTGLGDDDVGNGAFDFCALGGTGRIQVFEPGESIVSDVARIIRQCGADFGGVEYLVNSITGAPCFYDFNPYSNFVSNGKELLGYSPEERFVEFAMETLNPMAQFASVTADSG